jgi:formyl-CoA transferase
MFADPQVQHVGMAVPMPHPTRKDAAVVNQAVDLSRTACAINRPTPGLGEHTEEILTALGYSTNDIKALRSKKVV